MGVTIIGAAGMIGRKLAERLARAADAGRRGGAAAAAECVTADLSAPGGPRQADFDKGHRVELDGTRHLSRRSDGKGCGRLTGPASS